LLKSLSNSVKLGLEMTDRPFLTARWTDLLLLNFVVPRELIERVAPAGTQPDLHEGVAYISIVGFRFQNVRMFGMPIPGHGRFDEINLRYYVKREVAAEVRRGVVFVREIAPKLAVSILANRVYHENYLTRPMRSVIAMQGTELRPGDTLEYAWQNGRDGLLPQRRKCQLQKKWNRLAARVAEPLAVPPPNSLEEFIVEHYWGYSHGRDGCTREYSVAHPAWRVARAEEVIWDCDVRATYDSPFAEYLRTQPASALIADGSAIQVHHGRQLPGQRHIGHCR
jgi:uncharacterized protein